MKWNPMEITTGCRTIKIHLEEERSMLIAAIKLLEITLPGYKHGNGKQRSTEDIKKMLCNNSYLKEYTETAFAEMVETGTGFYNFKLED